MVLFGTYIIVRCGCLGGTLTRRDGVAESGHDLLLHRNSVYRFVVDCSGKLKKSGDESGEAAEANSLVGHSLIVTSSGCVF